MIFHLLVLMVLCCSPLAFASELHDAAKAGDLEKVKELLTQGTDVNTKDSDGCTPLHRAAEEGRTPVARMLLDHGTEVNTKNKSGETPLHSAVTVQSMWREEVERLFARQSKERGHHPDPYAVQRNCLEVVQLLLASGVDVNAKTNESGMTALHLAAGLEDDAPRIRLLPEEQLSVKVVKLLLATGADVHATDTHLPNPVYKESYLRTPLHVAAMEGSKGVIELLLSHGARINDRVGVQENKNPHPPGVVGVDLLGYQVSAEGLGSLKDMTPLHFAAFRDRKDIIKLLAHKADINARDSQGRIPLHFAAIWDRRRVAEIFLAHGADMNAKSDRGWTPLHFAVQHHGLNVAELLLASGADVNAKGQGGANLLGRIEGLDEALRDHKLDMSELTIIHEESHDSITPLALALQLHNTAMSYLLRKYGAQDTSPTVE